MEEKYSDYLKFVQDAKSYNNLLFVERKLRLPFIDTQTGVAQTDCSLWRSKQERDHVHQEGSNGTIYSYPAVRWQKRRREYLMKLNLPASSESPVYRASNGCSLNGTLSHNCPQQCHSASCSGVSKGTIGVTCQPSSNPTRADSTGSHSCMTVDSDSRDLSFATSQSFDSPRHQIEEEQSSNCYELLFPKDRQEIDNCPSKNNHDHQTNRGDPSAVPSANGKDTLASQDDEQQSLKQKLEDQTKAAIRLHSKMSKRKNVGQSLMRSNSILVKDGRKPMNGIRALVISDGGGVKTQSNTQTPPSPLRADTNSHESVTVAPATMCNGSRPYACSICDHTYKTRPGLSYHFIHSHNTTLPRNMPVKNKDEKKVECRAKMNNSSSKSGASGGEQSILVKDCVRTLRNGRMTRAQQRTNEVDEKTVDRSEQAKPDIDIDQSIYDGQESVPHHVSNGKERCFQQSVDAVDDNNFIQAGELRDRKIHSHELLNINGTIKLENTYADLGVQESNDLKKSHLKQNPFCDFCLGTVEKNRRTRLPEELVSCFSCGSSGHPSCLRFSDNIRISIRKYNWQCIECKTCSTCNNADNEDQLLFCDDCDRSYHTYCLSPPLIDLPEGNWSCKSCIAEYHDRNKG